MNLTSSIIPVILGSGRAGHAIAKSFACLAVLEPELGIQPCIWLKRGQTLETQAGKNALLCIANPHALHATSILAGSLAGYRAILCEKPSVVNRGQLQSLQAVKTPTAILHIYRQMWGLKTMKSMLTEGTFGELITIEGRYWQASTAERVLQTSPTPATAWKNDVNLAGNYDAFIDVATHWVDAVSFLHGSKPVRIQGWRSFIGAETPHRESHVQLSVDFAGGRAFGSVSKIVHGATNHFEITVVGSKLSATWDFLNPDEIQIGKGRDRQTLTRKNSILGSLQPPHHAMGWLEGYIEIIRQLIRESFFQQTADYPRLSENLGMMEAMLATEWQE